MKPYELFIWGILSANHAASFSVSGRPKSALQLPLFATTTDSTTEDLDAVASQKEKRDAVKRQLLQALGASTNEMIEPIFVDPISKEPLTVYRTQSFLSGDTKTRSSLRLESPSNRTFIGSTDTFINLLHPVESTTTTTPKKTTLLQAITPFIPPPLRSAVATFRQNASSDNDNDDDAYVPMRDLFTSPAVSYAYERGWRQNFAAAGFPGVEREAEMAMDYFAPATQYATTGGSSSSVVVDMSCATGLFTRRFAGKYGRVIGGDYSASMLREAAARRVVGMELVQLDVGQIPLADGVVDALHAGAAMHCWPDVTAALLEIYRVLRPEGGRFFATTFLSEYFRVLQSTDSVGSPSQQAFQYFRSVDEIRTLLMNGGFERSKISIEVLGSACVVIRCEK